MKIFMWIVGAVTAIVKFLDLRLRWQAKNEGKKKEAERLKRLERIDDVIARGDEKGMNDLLEDQRKRRKAKETGSVRPAVLASVLSVFLLALPLSGCISRQVVIPSDRHVVRLKLDNVDGWFFPDIVAKELLEGYVNLSCMMTVYGEMQQIEQETQGDRQ